MRLRTPVVVALVALLVASAAATPAIAQEQQQTQEVSGYPDLSFSTSAGGLDPGSATQIPLSVINRGNVLNSGPSQHEERVQTARGLEVEVDSGSSPIEVNTGTMVVGNVPSGGQQIGMLDLTVPGDIEPGTYSLDVEYTYTYTRTVEYTATSTQYDDLTRTRSETLEVRIDDQARFSVDNVSSSVLVGQSGEVAVEMTNTGSQTARDATVNLQSQSGELTFGSGSQSASAYVGRWEAGETRTLTFDGQSSPEADTGSYSAQVSVNYADANDVDHQSRPKTVGIPVGGEQNFAIADVESSLRVGYEGTVSATLINEGPQPIEDPVVMLTASNQHATVTAGQDAISNLEPGERTQVNFTVDVSSDASASRQQFEMLVSWDTPSGDRLTSTPLRPTVQIRPPQDRFTVDATNSTIPAGESRIMEIDVTNRGEEPLRNIEAMAFYSGPLSGEDDQGFIPELGPGETESIAIDVAVDSSANPETRAISMDFRYELPSGTSEYSDEYQLPITITEPESGGGALPLFIGLAIAVAIGGVILYRRRQGEQDRVVSPT